MKELEQLNYTLSAGESKIEKHARVFDIIMKQVRVVNTDKIFGSKTEPMLLVNQEIYNLLLREGFLSYRGEHG